MHFIANKPRTPHMKLRMFTFSLVKKLRTKLTSEADLEKTMVSRQSGSRVVRTVVDQLYFSYFPLQELLLYYIIIIIILIYW
jgi:hypothetical protein